MTLWDKLKKQLPNKATKPEKILYQTLKNMGIRFMPQYWVGRYRADAYLPDFNIVVEVDGEYWHNKPKQRAIDRRKDQFYKSRGYIVARVQSKPFMSDPETWIRGTLKRVK